MSRDQAPTAFCAEGLAVHATTACLPTQRFEVAAERLSQGLHQEPWGALSLAHVQICPQHPFALSEGLLDTIAGHLPASRLRLHATVPVMRRHFTGEHAWWSEDSRAYWERVAQLSRHIRAPAYTFHAGTRAGHTFGEMLDQARRFEQLFECPVGIEGLYPDPFRKHDWLVDSWEEYRQLMESGVCYALDLSHLNILARVSRRIDAALVKDLLAHPHCIEVHVSDNDGLSDRHQMLRPGAPEALWWMDLLAHAALNNPQAAVFSESARAWDDCARRVVPDPQAEKVLA